MSSSISANVQHIRETIQRAAQQCGRDPASVCVIAATKTVSYEQLEEAYASQLRHFGENRWQEAQEKMERFGHREGVSWHFIGRMQRRKLKALVGRFCLLHSVESLEQAQELDRLADQSHLRQDVLLQVNIGDEGSKGGFSVAGLKQVIDDLDQLAHLNIRGLMALPPWTQDPEASRPHFARLREVRDELARQPLQRMHLRDLSMGMSHDYHIAVQEGATFVRIGTAIFGARV
ncbi:MAG: YggS family pyridoxal phosphate-dependent enzyme [Nitrospirales bacterium]